MNEEYEEELNKIKANSEEIYKQIVENRYFSNELIQELRNLSDQAADIMQELDSLWPINLKFGLGHKI